MLNNQKCSLQCLFPSLRYSLLIGFLFMSILSWSQSYPNDFQIHLGCLKPLLGYLESGEHSCYSVNLEDCNESPGPVEESEGILSTPTSDEGSIGYKYLGKTTGNFHVLRVWDSGGGILTMQSVLLLRLGKHTVLVDDDNQVIQKEKQIITFLGQIMLFGDEVFAVLENDILTYLSQEKVRTFDLSILQSNPSETPVEESSEELLTTVDMIEHTSKELDKADLELNQVYKDLMKKMDQEGQEKLRKSQRAWMAFRDSNAEFMADEARGGLLSSVLHISTQVQMTKDRVQELKQSQLGE